MTDDRAVLVAGGGGFIGGALVADLLASGARVRSVDVKPVEAWHQVHEDAETLVLDLRLRDHCEQAVAGITDVYNLAADMGGMGFIENNKALCMLSSLINTHLLDTSRSERHGRALLLCLLCVRLRRRQAGQHRRRTAAGGRRLPRRARGRLRLGEALR